MSETFPGAGMGIPPSPTPVILPPDPAQVMSELGRARRDYDPTMGVLDPAVSPKARLLTGAGVYTNRPGAARADYAQWRMARTSNSVTPASPRPGASPKQSEVLADPDDRNAAARALAGKENSQLAGWLGLYESGAGPAAPVDVARFDRAVGEGKVRGRGAELYHKARSGRLKGDVEANELAALVDRTSQMLDAFDDDLTLGNGRLLAVDTDGVQPRLRIAYAESGVDEPVSAPGAITALPASSMPPDALAGPTGDGITLDVGDDDAVFIAKTTVDNDLVNRRGFPAALGDDDTPRWLKVAAAHLRDANSVERTAVRTPTAKVDVHQHYAGTFPYDSIVFEGPQRLHPRVAELGAVSLGRGVANEPTLGGNKITAEELGDAEQVRRHLHEQMWAIFTTPPAKLHPKYAQIPVRSAGREGTLVFGITPGEAVESSAGLVYVNDGVARRDGVVADAPDDEWDVDAADGSTVSFVPDVSESLEIVDRRQRAVERWHIPLDEKTTKNIGVIADTIELYGARNVVAYAARPAVDGFELAREHLYTDATGNTVAARTADTVLGDFNAVPVWVRRADGLPSGWVPVPGEAHDTQMEEVVAERVGNRFRFDARGSDDLAAPIRAAHTLAQRYGYDRVEVIGDRGKVRLTEPRRG